ncbi:MAG: hypothetical protein HQK84_07175, partial [Nitrospinae bacterium]|nr:hypothetical protein [Nitrospinota bacterium]
LKNVEEKELQMELAKQRKDFSILEDKYNRVVGPARSNFGKLVVTVRFYKEEGKILILFKDIDAENFIQVSNEEMHKKLKALSEKHKENLYVKVSILSNSNLSYNEAWKLTQEVLSKYDYYYRENNQKESK